MTKSRVGRLLLVGACAGCCVVICYVSVLVGWHSAMAWFLGTAWPPQENVQLSSAGWLVGGALLWMGLQLLVPKVVPGPVYRVAALLAGPIVATWCVFAWSVSFILYRWGVWDSRVPPFGARWLLDGPPMAAWYSVSNAALQGLQLAGPVNPAGNGFDVHTPGTVIVLGILNEAMFAAVLASCASLVAAVAHGTAMRRARAA